MLKSLGIEAARGSRRRAHANAARHKRAAGLVGNGVLVHGKTDAFKQFFGVLTGHVGRREIDQAQVVVGAARHQTQAAIGQGRRPARRQFFTTLSMYVVEFGLADASPQRNGLTRDHVHERAALAAREHRGVDFLRESLVVGEDEAAARAAQGLVRGGGHDVGVRHGRLDVRPQQPGRQCGPCRP